MEKALGAAASIGGILCWGTGIPGGPPLAAGVLPDAEQAPANNSITGAIQFSLNFNIQIVLPKLARALSCQLCARFQPTCRLPARRRNSAMAESAARYEVRGFSGNGTLRLVNSISPAAPRA